MLLAPPQDRAPLSQTASARSGAGRRGGGGCLARSCAELPVAVGIVFAPADIEPHVAADNPSQFLRGLLKQVDGGLTFSTISDLSTFIAAGTKAKPLAAYRRRLCCLSRQRKRDLEAERRATGRESSKRDALFRASRRASRQ
jgi:hypothetical protein